VREIDLTPEQRADLLAFVRDDGKGLVATHAGSTAFFSWPEFGDMLGGRFDEHPWNIVNANVIVDDQKSPMTAHLPKSFDVVDEHSS
jgi:type 1 glutamine amidotransferase